MIRNRKRNHPIELIVFMLSVIGLVYLMSQGHIPRTTTFEHEIEVPTAPPLPEI